LVLDALVSERTAFRAEAQAVEDEVRRLNAELVADVEEAACQLRRSAAVQLCGAAEYCRHRHDIIDEQRRAEEKAAEMQTQLAEQRGLLDVQLEEVAQQAASSKKALAERRRSEEARASKKRKALHAKIASAQHKADKLECAEFQIGLKVRWTDDDDDVPEGSLGVVVGFTEAAEVRVRFPKGTWSFEPAELTKAPSAALELENPLAHCRGLVKAHLSHDSILEPMMRANRHRYAGNKAGGLHAEYPLIGALKELEQGISRAAAPVHRVALPAI